MSPIAKKPTSAKPKTHSHPPYSQMISEAIISLKERTGSSQIAIAKFIEEKQKNNLPANFKKMLLVQLKKLVANGKLVKVKNSYKIPSKSTSSSAEKVKVPSKPKVSTESKTKKATKKVSNELKTKNSTKTGVKKSPGKKAVSVKSPMKKKMKKTPMKGKKPKSIKSPAKKVAAKKAKK